MPERPTRVRLTAQQKLAVHKHRAAHPDLTLSAMCAWAVMALKLPKTPSLSAMSLLLKTPTSDDAVRARPMLKTAQRVVSPELEARLVAWVRKCEQLRIPVVSWPTLRGKAEKIRAALLADPQHAGDKRLNALRFSDGWVQKLQQRHGLKPRRVSGEAASARASEVERGRAGLIEVTKQYNAQDIFNMDESAFFYCTPPTSAVSTSRMPGRKVSKKRITVALTTNSDGSHKVPLLFVGQAAKPRCFGGKSSAELGVDYTSSKKGWMTTSIFVAWLERFDAQMAEEGRHVLLLLDNASPHRVPHVIKWSFQNNTPGVNAIDRLGEWTELAKG